MLKTEIETDLYKNQTKNLFTNPILTKTISESSTIYNEKKENENPLEKNDFSIPSKNLAYQKASVMIYSKNKL